LAGADQCGGKGGGRSSGSKKKWRRYPSSPLKQLTNYKYRIQKQGGTKKLVFFIEVIRYCSTTKPESLIWIKQNLVLDFNNWFLLFGKIF
jgi:hypothetical protein